MAALQFAPWSSDIELSFYAALASLKINHDKLDDAARKVVGRYEVQPNDAPERSTRMQVHGNAFTTDEVPMRTCRAEGTVKNVNTIEEYKSLDRAAVMERAGRTIWDAILDGTIYSCPSLLSSFYAIFFADLKKYRFTYHFAFPALHSDPPWRPEGDTTDDSISKLSDPESSLLFDAVQTWRYAVDTRQHGFFLAKRGKLSYSRRNSLEWQDELNDERPTDDARPQTPKTPKAEDLGFQWVVASLSSFENGFFNDSKPEDCFVCFVDPSTYPKNPGWMLRNLLVLIRQRWRLESVQILCYRDTQSRREEAHSVLLKLASKLPPVANSSTPLPSTPKVTGWERNENNKLNSRLVDLAEYMDPRKLADQSVDLNLKLMKWRIAPNLNLDAIKNTKCLLLGAGTLGSYVSRNLLGWGVRKITFVDNGKVSFSNPVRQPLFNFNDCVDGGAKKALRAAEALQEIYPGVDSEGFSMSVPMAGHPITDERKAKEDFELLQKLIQEHDVIFLLLDTRESRWLPTVIGKAEGKIVMNAALGFDTYVVMRHGVRAVQGASRQPLGCYFCNDVVAPADSVKDQTLDQQCTVTRPGIAAIASALLVELLVSVLQHPDSGLAPAPPNRAAPRSPFDHPLGHVPHQIRGFLSSFDNLLIHGPSYDCCSACSDKITGPYLQDGWEFIRKALSDKNYVEELSGLAEVQRKAEAAAADLDWDEEENEVGEIDDEGEGELL